MTTGTLTIGLTVPILATAIWLWVLDIFGVERWTAEKIGFYIGMILEASKAS